MNRGLQLLIILLLYSISAFSQVNRYGTPLVSSFDAAGMPGELQNHCITMDSSGVMYFGNEAGGIVTYDGINWGLIKTPGTAGVSALVTDPRGIVYAGGRNNFGVLQPDEAGRISYISLSERIGNPLYASSVNDIVSAAADSTSVVFTDGKLLYIVGLTNDSVGVIDMKSEYGISNVSAMTAFDSRIIIADDEAGLFEYREGRIAPVNGGESVVPARFVKLLPYDRDNLLLGATGSDLMLFNMRTGALNGHFSDEVAADAFRNGTLTDLAILPGSMIAAGLDNRRGIYIFGHDGTLYQHISDMTTTLGESSVTAMYCDYASNSPLWFCTRGFINRAYVSLPASEFNKASGIRDVACTVEAFEGSLYAGTSDGLYVSYSEPTGIRRFIRTEVQETGVNDLVTVMLPGGNALIAATEDGLWQVDEEKEMQQFLRGMKFNILYPSHDDRAVIVAGSGNGTVMILRYEGNRWKIDHTLAGMVPGTITDIEQTAPGEWWMVTDSPSSLLRMHCETNDTTFIIYGSDRGVISDTVNSVELIDNVLYLCTGRGIFHYDRPGDTFAVDHDLAGSSFDDVNIKMVFRAPEGEVFLSGYDSRNFDALVTATRQGHVVFRRHFDFLPDIATSGADFFEGRIWLSKGRSLFVLDKSKVAFRYGAFRTIFTRIISGKNILLNGTFYNERDDGTRVPSAVQPASPVIVLSNRDNNITFRWATTSFVDESKTEHRYRLEGFEDEWSGWEKRYCRDYTNLPSGDYRFVVRARTNTGLEGEELAYAFSVRKPWYWSAAAIIVYFVVAGWVLFSLARFLSRRLNIRKRRLESLLRQRNEATVRGRNEISELENYAGMVQQVLLPSEHTLSRVVPNSFVLNRPRSAVSGDFFWVANSEHSTVIAVGDCTGHGVSSSLRTVLAVNFLGQIAGSQESMTTSLMLQEFRHKLSETFRSNPSHDVRQEGIDISLLAIDWSKKEVGYSGAAAQCFRVRVMNDHERARWDKGEFKPNEGTMASGKYLLETVYGDRIPLGMHLDGDHVFTQHTWKLEKESSYYLFTDGYSDQFNGTTGKKFLKKNLRKLVLDIQNFHMGKQKEILEERLTSWMGKSPQTDDILVVGLRIE
jgi:serine phosphatase RsbU (regulator of sigma subunit)